MDEKERTRARTETLKNLRSQHKTTVERTQILLKVQKRIQQAIIKSVGEKSKTVPEIALDVGLTAHETLWHVASLKKYGILSENGMSEDYPLYERVEVKKV